MTSAGTIKAALQEHNEPDPRLIIWYMMGLPVAGAVTTDLRNVQKDVQEIQHAKQ